MRHLTRILRVIPGNILKFITGIHHSFITKNHSFVFCNLLFSDDLKVTVKLVKLSKE